MLIFYSCYVEMGNWRPVEMFSRFALRFNRLEQVVLRQVFFRDNLTNT